MRDRQIDRQRQTDRDVETETGRQTETWRQRDGQTYTQPLLCFFDKRQKKSEKSTA